MRGKLTTRRSVLPDEQSDAFYNAVLDIQQTCNQGLHEQPLVSSQRQML